MGAMSKDSSGTVQQTAETFGAVGAKQTRRWLCSRWRPSHFFLVRSMLARDNARENRKDRQRCVDAGRGGLQRGSECGYARDGFVLDIGCSQGILQEGRYGRYLGVDNCEQSIQLARPKCDRWTQFVCADGFDFVADHPPDAVVMNEVIYYLPIRSPRSSTTRGPGTRWSRDCLDLRPYLVLSAAPARPRSTP